MREAIETWDMAIFLDMTCDIGTPIKGHPMGVWGGATDDRGGPALSKWFLGFDSWLVLGSPRVEIQQKWSCFDPLLSWLCHPLHLIDKVTQDWTRPNMFLLRTERVQTCSHHQNDPSWQSIRRCANDVTNSQSALAAIMVISWKYH